MKCILEFDLDNQEDVEKHEECILSSKLRSSIWELDEYLRRELKYKEVYKENEYETLEIVRNKLNEILYDNDVKGLFK